MNCNCSVDTCDFRPEFYHQFIHKARKMYECCECHSKITPGQKYEKIYGKWDGEIMSFRTCLTCVKIRQDYCPEGYMIGELRETLIECLELDYTKSEKK